MNTIAYSLFSIKKHHEKQHRKQQGFTPVRAFWWHWPCWCTFCIFLETSRFPFQGSCAIFLRIGKKIGFNLIQIQMIQNMSGAAYYHDLDQKYLNQTQHWVQTARNLSISAQFWHLNSEFYFWAIYALANGRWKNFYHNKFCWSHNEITDGWVPD